MVSFGGFEFSLTEWGVALGFFVGSILLAHVVLLAFDRFLRPLLAKTKTVLDDMLFESLRGPMMLLFAIFGAYLGACAVAPGFQIAGRGLDNLLALALIVAGGHAVAKALSAVLSWYPREIGVGRAAVGDVFPLVRKLIKVAVYVATAIIVLSELGVEIGPLVAGLGIAGLAVALALQDSLKNFFAGLYLIADKPVRVGDLIALDSDASDVKGFVEEIGWRSARIRTQPNIIYIVPNEKLAQSVIINYTKGRDTKSVAVKVGVEYAQDAEYALEALKQACEQTIKKSEFADASVKPVVRVENFLDSAIELAAVVRVKDYAERFSVASDLRRRILLVFKKKKINIPFPVRTVYLGNKKTKQ